MIRKANVNRAKNVRYLIVLLHGWTGIFASLFIFLVAATGLALAFFGELFELQYGDMVRAIDGPTADIGEIIAAAETGHPSLETAGVFTQDTRVAGLQTALVHGPSEAAESGYMMVSVDPVTAEYKGTFELAESFAHEFNDFHFSLLMGNWAITFIAIIGIVLIALTLSGLYMWWPHSRARAGKLFKLQTKGKIVPKMFNWHGLAGIWIGLLTLLFAITGIGLSKPDWLGPAIAQMDEPAIWDARFKKDCGDTVTVSQAADQALAAFPGHEITTLNIVRGEENKYTIGLRDEGDWNVRFGDAYVEVHTQCAGEMWATTLSQQNAPAIFGTLMLSLHGGHIFGPLQETLTVLTGLAVMLLSGTGVYVFFMRTLPAQRSRKAKKRKFSAKQETAAPAK